MQMPLPRPASDLLVETLAAAVRDTQTVTPEGKPVGSLTEGVVIRPAPTHLDERGSITEMLDPRWGWHPEPFAYAYLFTIRPGYVKGWNLHREHEDRYFVVSGEMELVLYDPRPDSRTCGQVCRVALSGAARSIVNVPADVWHADRNIGSGDVLVVNFPTKPYDHARPDKYRLPLDSPLIPHSFGDLKGW